MGKETNNCFYSINYYKGNVSCFLLFPCWITKLCSWLQPLVPPWGEDTAPPCKAVSHTAPLWAVQCSPHYCSSAQQNTVLQLCTTKQHSTAALHNNTTQYCSSVQQNNLQYCSSAQQSNLQYCSSAQQSNLQYCSSVQQNNLQYCSSAQQNNIQYWSSAQQSNIQYWTSNIQYCSCVQQSNIQYCSCAQQSNIQYCSSAQQSKIQYCSSTQQSSRQYCSSAQQSNIVHCTTSNIQYCSSAQQSSRQYCSSAQQSNIVYYTTSNIQSCSSALLQLCTTKQHTALQLCTTKQHAVLHFCSTVALHNEATWLTQCAPTFSCVARNKVILQTGVWMYEDIDAKRCVAVILFQIFVWREKKEEEKRSAQGSCWDAALNKCSCHNKQHAAPQCSTQSCKLSTTKRYNQHAVLPHSAPNGNCNAVK